MNNSAGILKFSSRGNIKITSNRKMLIDDAENQIAHPSPKGNISNKRKKSILVTPIIRQENFVQDVILKKRNSHQSIEEHLPKMMLAARQNSNIS